MTASVMMHKNIYEAVYNLTSQLHSKVTECHQKFKDLEASIPAWLRMNPDTQSADLLYRQLALEGSMARKLLCLFVPLMHKKEFPDAKKEVLKAAHRSMKMYCAFDARSAEMSMYRWMGQLWMFTAPLLSTLIVSMDLVASGSTESASWVLVDQTLAALIRTPEFENMAEATVICDAVEILRSQRLFEEGFGVALNRHSGFDYGGMQWVEGFLLNHGGY
ncbi:hypothetical protein NEOLI_003313 [Neolecta irregularis DAH-3]|uniref:Uncharacterized protein n=1 Tax=Neolecta irregularis (strain DAH-3) TaxID=1198029 RepID=A0A1U7LMZ1_NEOID|nr:hypothetical protein NEOLI_003313 [Neolecta irregularis DAH-3]|eukprot:OLL23953.1 hypothetical protein NEOLI_003313 [Neolecta irregularis DAH-3]